MKLVLSISEWEREDTVRTSSKVEQGGALSEPKGSVPIATKADE